jgi:curli biogenesis system outer membrane secretion channel CsgG
MKAALAIMFCLMTMLGGCMAGAKPSAQEAPMEIGHYPAPPVNLSRPRVAVAPFHVTIDRGFASEVDLSDIAADEMLKLMDATARFNLIERVRFGQILREQHLSDVLEPGEWAHPAPLAGVNYVVIGRVLSLSAVAADPAAGFGVSKMQQMVGMGDDRNHRVNVTVSCNVDLRLVDPATGSPRIDIPRVFRRTASAAAFGLDLGDRDLGNLALKQNESQGILRMILDEELRQMLPQIDGMLQSQANAPPPQSAANAGSSEESASAAKPAAAPTTTSPALRRICPECGADVSIYDEFCPNCKARLPHVGGPFTQPAHPAAPEVVK